MRRVCPIPINEAEAIVVRFFDPQRSQLEQWDFTCDPAACSAVKQHFHASVILWEQGAGKTVGRLHREMNVDAGSYDHLSICATMPATARLTVRVVVDGREQIPIADVRGTNTSEEIEGPLTPGVITEVDIEITDHGSDPGNAQLFWLGLFHEERRQVMRGRPNPFSGSWDDLMMPSGKPVELQVQLGLFFDTQDLARLRHKASREPYRTLMNKLRKLAAAELTKEPWRGVGAFPNNLAPRCYRLRGEEHISLMAMRAGAFVGLLEENEALMRMAVNHALALAHCDHWQPEFLASMPGSSWEQRAFYEYRYAQNTIFAWDWAGAYLTEAGKQLLAQAISTKALPWILQTLMRHPYVRGCNQGVYFSWGAIICELALARIYPYAGELLDAAVKALDETVSTYFSADGGAFEGPGYVTSTLGHALCAYQAVARHRGLTLAEIAPPILARTADYLKTMISTVPPYGSAIKVADGGRAGPCIYPEALGLLWQLNDDPAIPALLAGMLSQDELREFPGTPGTPFCLIFGPDELPEPAARPATFHILPQTGMLCSNRPTPDGPVRLQLIGAPAHAGHCHQDRGSFVLEAFGEEIAIDRGQMGYDDPRCTTIGLGRYHNLLIPEDPENQVLNQLNPCPAATIPEGDGDEQTLRCRIDVSAACWCGFSP